MTEHIFGIRGIHISVHHRVMGIDPGLRATGYGIIDIAGGEIRLVEGGVVRTAASDPLSRRLSTIYNDVKDVIAKEAPSVLAIEDLFTSYSHPQTAVLMGHARGVIFLAGAANGLDIRIYTATMVKRALTGNGHASKSQVGRMVASLLKLNEMPGPDHVTDALALALCHYNMMRMPELGSMNRHRILKKAITEECSIDIQNPRHTSRCK